MDGSRAAERRIETSVDDVAPGLLLDTALVSPTDAFRYWSETSEMLFGPIRSQRSSTKTPFFGQFHRTQLGPLTIYRTHAAPVRQTRTARMMRASRMDALGILFHLEGRCVIDTRNQQIELQPGDAIALDHSTPLDFDCDGDTPFRNMEIQVPQSMVRPYGSRIEQSFGVRLPGSLQSVRLAHRFVADLADTLSPANADTANAGGEYARFAESAFELVLALCLRFEEKSVSSTTRRHMDLLHQVMDYIDEHLGSEDLTPMQIANANSISPRMLYKLFELEGRSLGEWIRERRVERSRQDLADPLLASQSIGQIAYRWGFRNQAHFSRIFRSMSGCSPREFRREMLGAH